MTYDRQMSQAALFFLIVTSVFSIWHMAPNGPALVQAQTPPISSSGLNTQVSAPINLPNNVTQYNITGGTRPGNGPNLFHSFGEFGVPTNNIANFLNDSALPTNNILGRVTGGNISNIFGTIETTGFGNANLFLMNPAGFLFGPNATVNVGGMIAFTSADYLKLTDNARFNAIPNAAADALLTALPVASFGFLGSNPGAITVQGSQLTVTEGAGISLVGGNITVQSGILDGGIFQPARLAAPGGQINLASVVSPGEVSASDYHPDSGMMRGGITLAEGARLDVSGNAAGTVRIRSGNFVMENAAISADTLNANGAPVAIDINVTGDLSISTLDVPGLTAITTGAGDAGEIRVSSGSMGVNATAVESVLYSVIDTHTSGQGEAGDVSIVTGDLTVIGEPVNGFTFFVDSGTTSLEGGHGGDVDITARIIQAQDTAISTGNFLALNLGEESTGSAGNLSITADRLQFTNTYLVTDAFSLTSTTGESGNIAITAHDINLDFSVISNLSQERGASIAINTDSLVANNSQILSETGLTPGGGITVNGRIIELTNGSNLASSTAGDGNAGPIYVTATDHLGLLGPSTNDRPSGIFSNSFGTFGSLGNSGDIVIDTPRLEMTGGARINTTTATSGRGGNVIINAPDSISMSGETGGQFPEPLFSLGTIQPSGIYTFTIGGNCTGSCGNAGNVAVATGSLMMGTGSQINSGTRSSGQGGNIAIVARDTITMAGTLSTGQPGGIHSGTIGTEPDSGSGGNIALAPGQSFTISDGASVSASSTGSGNAGNITIQGLASPAESVLIDGPGSGIFTDTQGTGTGGNIFVDADSVMLKNGGTLSAITSGTEATATGGTITVHANQVQLNNQANITATSTRQPDKPNSGAGNAGTITMTAKENIVLLGNSSILSEAEGEGNGGLVSLTAPSIELHGNSNIETNTTGLGNAGNIELQGNQVSLTESFVMARTQAEGRGGNITIRGLIGEGSRATDINLSDNSQLVSETFGDGENIQGAAGNILVETARLNLSGRSLFNTTSRGSTGAAGNITVNATDSLTISGIGSQLNSASLESSFGDAGHISISAPSVVIENNGRITTSTGLVGNAGTITVNTNNLQLLSGGHITSSSLAEFPEAPPSGAAGTVSILGLASPAQSVLIDGAGSGIFTDTQGTGAGGNIVVNANSVTLQNGGTLSASSTGQVEHPGNAGNIEINATNGLTMQDSIITTQAGQGAGGGNIKVTTSPEATVWLQNSKISASVADGHGGGGNISIDPQFVILQNSQILAQATQGQGGAITITAGLFLQDANSKVNADSGSGVNGTVTIQSPNAPASGKIQPLGKTPLQATSLLNQRCAALAGGEFSSFTVAGRDSLPTEPGSWLASPLYAAGVGEGLGIRGEGLEGDVPILSLRQIAPAGFLTQAFAVDWSTGCKS